MSPAIRAADLPADVRKKLGVKLPRQRSMTIHEVRTHALRMLGVVADLTQSERLRVLKHAVKLNGV
jgi:hypothetical protein